MSTRDLYGLKTDDLKAARVVAKRALGVALEPRNSSYYGGDHYRNRSDKHDEIIVQLNNDGEEGGWVEEDYREFAVLLRKQLDPVAQRGWPQSKQNGCASMS